MIVNKYQKGGGSGSGSTVTWQQTVTGGTKIARISIDGSGQDVFCPSGSTYELPTASSSTLGGVKIGNGLSIDANGVLSTKVVALSQAEYDALVQAGTVDANTLYVII